MRRGPDQENRFNQLDLSQIEERGILVRRIGFDPADSAKKTIMDGILEPLANRPDCFGLTIAQIVTLTNYATRAGNAEYDRVKSLSKTTAAHAVDEALADVQGIIGLEPISVQERRARVAEIQEARLYLRRKVDRVRQDVKDEGKFHFGHLGEQGAEEYILKRDYPGRTPTFSTLDIVGDNTDLLMREFGIGGTQSITELKREYRPRTYPGSTSEHYYSLPTRIPGVFFTVHLFSDEERPFGAESLRGKRQLELLFRDREMIENYRYFDTTKPAVILPI